jgi:hypothetical protein
MATATCQEVCSVPSVLLTYVECPQGHKLSGLFVLYRPEPKKGFLAQFTRDKEKFALGLVSASGHLLTVTDDDPWKEYYQAPGSPEAWELFYDYYFHNAAKLHAEVSYEFHLIRHPSVSWARQAQKELNGEAPKQLHTDTWTPIVFTPVLSNGAFQANILQFSEDATDYHPIGGQRYGGWCLYADMPHAGCPKLKPHVQKLQDDLAHLLYIVGGKDYPYSPETSGRDDGDSTHHNYGIFDGRTLNAVYVFQKDFAGGERFKLNQPMVSSPKEFTTEITLSFLDGSGSSTAGNSSLKPDGVVTDFWADQIAAWIGGQLRNPNHVMFTQLAKEDGPRYWQWLRPESASALYAWRELTKALGFSRSIHVAHTYRHVLQDMTRQSTPIGRSSTSIHKTGLAIDVSMAPKDHFEKPAADWPIIYMKDERVDVDAETFYIRWRLFAVSQIPMDRDGVKICRDNLQKLLDKKRSPLEEAFLFGRLKEAATQMIKEIDASLAGEGDGSAFVEKYFREQVAQWQYDPWDVDCGKEGPQMYASEAALSEEEKKDPPESLGTDQWNQVLDDEVAGIDQKIDKLGDPDKLKQSGKDQLDRLNKQKDKKEDERKTLSQATHFLDLTALAEMDPVGLHRIHSWKTKRKAAKGNWGLAGQSVKVREFAKLTKGLADAAKDHPDVPFEIGKVHVPLKTLDTDFMQQWSDYKKSLTLCGAKFPNLVCAVSANDRGGEKRVAEATAALDNFGDQTFVRVDPGSTDKKSGADWSTEIKNMLEQIKNTAPAKTTDSKKDSSKKKASDWIVTLAPVFGSAGEGDNATPLTFDPPGAVVVPQPGVSVPMEWWHYQLDSSILQGNKPKAFGDLLGELGFDNVTACGERDPAIYDRCGLGYPSDLLTHGAG